ncbi:MAG: ATP-binding cassette domain-containing protein [Methanospirillum sp.]|nr:ATP-binding cassette domain-containing protein [Methanospirillum sp.]
MPFTIEARDLTKVFGATTAVDRVSFSVRQGEIFGFLGPNGAGKTTTTRMLTGVIPADGGTATVLGHDMRTDPVRARQRFGVVPETANAYADLSAWQNLMLMGELFGLERRPVAARASELLGVLDLSERKDQKVQAYSKGMKQRLILAMALLHEPELVFLDEPTSGLDVRSAHLILALLRDMNREGTTIFLTTHNMEEANRLCDRVGIIRRGRLVALDAPERLKSAIQRIHRVEVSFDREISGSDITSLEAVVTAEREGDKWRLVVDDTGVAVRAVVDLAREQGAAIVTLNTPAPSLDEAFLQLTGEEMP